jgi:hypothetical protein
VRSEASVDALRLKESKTQTIAKGFDGYEVEFKNYSLYPCIHSYTNVFGGNIHIRFSMVY